MGQTKGLERLWAPWRMEYIRRAEAASARAAGRREGVGAGRALPPPAARPARGAGRRGAAREGSAEECLFCRVGETRGDRADLVLARRPRALLMLNRFPYNPGHLMAAVVRHAGSFADLAPAERADLLDLVALAERALAAEYRPHGVNYGANVGRVAGAGFPGHLHLHLVPRWNGDTNFMPVIGETKVLPESLARTWTRLRRALGALERTARATRRGPRARR